MVAHLAYLAFVKHDDLVGALNGREAVRDDERGAIGHQAFYGLLNQLLGLGVNARGGFIEYQDARVKGQRAREGNQLLLPD